MNIDKELVGASTGILILRIISERPSYGYEIVKSVNSAAGGAFTWQEGTVYPVLRKLEAEGLLDSAWEESENGRRRKYYYITHPGREALREGAAQWQTFYRIVARPMEAFNG